MPKLVKEPDLKWLTHRTWTCHNCGAVVQFAKEDLVDISIRQFHRSDGANMILNFEADCPFCEQTTVFE
jgi:hypothetical protein